LIAEAEKQIDQEILVDDAMIVEIAEKTVEDVTMTLPQQLNLEMGKSESLRDHKLDELGLADEEDLPQVSGESFIEHIVSTVNVIMQQLPCPDSVLNLVEEMEFIMPVGIIAGVQTAKEDRLEIQLEIAKTELMDVAEKESLDGIVPVHSQKPESRGLKTDWAKSKGSCQENIAETETSEDTGVLCPEIGNIVAVFDHTQVREQWQYETAGDEQETEVTHKDHSEHLTAEVTESELKMVTVAKEATHIVLCTEARHDDEMQTSFEIMLPTNENFQQFPITDTRVEGYDQSMEILQSEVQECNMRVAKTVEEAEHIILHVENQSVNAVTVEIMLPANKDDTALLVHDETRMLQDKVVLETADTMDENVCDVQVVQNLHKEVNTEVQQIEKAKLTVSQKAAADSTFTHLVDEQHALSVDTWTTLPEKAATSAVMTRLQEVKTEQAAERMTDETEIIITLQEFANVDAVTAGPSVEIETNMSTMGQPILIVPTANEIQDSTTTRQERDEKELSTQQSVAKASEMTTAEMSRAAETVAVTLEELQVKKSALHMAVTDVAFKTALYDAHESEMKVVEHEDRENEVITVMIDIQEAQKALMMVPQVTEGKAVSMVSTESESERQDEKVIEILSPVVCENAFAVEHSKPSALGLEEIKISMKTDTDNYVKSATAYEEVTSEQLLKQTSDHETYEKLETLKPLTERSVTEAVLFSSKTEHDIDLLTFQHAVDLCDDAQIACNQMTESASIFDDETVGELSDNKQQEITEVFQLESPEIHDMDIGIAVVSAQAQTLVMLPEDEHLIETEAAGYGAVTMLFSREAIVGERETSYIVFPALPAEDSVPDAMSINKTVVCSDTTREVGLVDDDTRQFHRAVAAPSMMVNEECTIVDDVQPVTNVPYVCSAQDNDSLEGLSGSLVERYVISSGHITETYASEEDECTLSLNEELSCDNFTIVFPEYVEAYSQTR